ncbi:hypothetical protein BH23VER1_BH23VER1_24910 [soil metagenome]
MGHIPEETIQEIFASTDIVEVVSGYFPLKRAGSVFKALCPFHTEKTPSFQVNPARNTFHCFGCGEGGGVINFVMKYENIAFPEAVRKLAAKAGIAISEDVHDPEEESRTKLRRRLLALHKDAAAWFHHLLLRDPVAEPAREYLKSRGLNADVARRWQLGFAPEDIALLLAWARQGGYSENLLREGGLASLRDEDNPARGVYARFRSRLMFPIANDYGEVIAFSGRVLDPDAKTAKYMNSPETQIFNKGKTFYGLDRAKRPILKESRAIICEGQLDLIACSEAGIENIVAPLGTAFTEPHARLLARHAQEVVLCYDADNAGFKAAERAFAELAKANIEVKVITMPDGQDPDSLIRSAGPDAFRALLDGALPFFDYQIERGIHSIDPTSIKDRIAFAEKVAANVAILTDKIAEDTAINNVATRLKIDPADLRQRVSKQRAEARRLASRPSRPSAAGPGPGDQDDRTGPPLVIENRSVAALCRLAAISAEAHAQLRQRESLDFLKDIPETDLLLKILEIPLPPEADSSPTARILSTLGRRDQACLSRLLDAPLPGTGARDAQQHLLGLKFDQLQRTLNAHNAHVTVASTAHIERAITLHKQMAELKSQQRALAAEAAHHTHDAPHVPHVPI